MKLLEILLMDLGGIWQGIRQDFNLLEIALIAVAFWAWQRGWRPRFSDFKIPCPGWVAAVVVAVGALALRLALLPVFPAPVPVVSDEFSHFLLADTLLHGRLANPTHPFWPHFESLHIIQQPHYVSNYFPGHAMVLAAARAVMGGPWPGVLAESSVFLMVLYWMLRGWMPVRWALFGTLLAALRFSIGSYWIDAYHGGFLAAIGGALVAGAFPRLRERSSVIQGSVLGLGLAILATTRPFEGLLFSLPFLAVLIWRRPLAAILKVAVPVVLLGGAAIAGLGVYFAHITGSPFVTTYQISQKTYGWPMGLAWRTVPHIEHRNIELKRYYDYEVSEHEKVDGPLDFIEYLMFRVQEYWRFFLGPVLSVPLIMLSRVWRRQRMLLVGVAAALCAVLMEGAASPHYIAPATGVIVAVIVECCRHLRAARAPIVPFALATMVLVLGLRVGAQGVGLPYTQKLNFQSWCCKVWGNTNKERITEALDRIPGNHLVFVKPKSDEYNLFQWIYNDADIDSSRIVWARDLGPEQDAQLSAYLAGRNVWVVDPNVEPATCRKY